MIKISLLVIALKSCQIKTLPWQGGQSWVPDSTEHQKHPFVSSFAQYLLFANTALFIELGLLHMMHKMWQQLCRLG